MYRGELIRSGTSSTGTGTLTLATCPVPPGGVDHFAAFGGMGFGTSQPVPIDYVIREYTDATFSTILQFEGGIGGLTLGANIGATTLARTTVQTTATGCNAPGPTYNFNAPSAISINTAANVLVECAPRALSIQGELSYTGAGNTTFSRDGVGVVVPANTAAAISSSNVNNQQINFVPFFLPISSFISTMHLRVSATYTGQNNNVYGALYFVNSSGLPGKLIADFGVIGTANASFGTLGNISSAVLSTPVWLPAGWYFFAVHPIWTTGGTGTPALASAGVQPLFNSFICGTQNFLGETNYTVGSIATTAFADPATTPTGVGTGSTFLAGFK